MTQNRLCLHDWLYQSLALLPFPRLYKQQYNMDIVCHFDIYTFYGYSDCLFAFRPNSPQRLVSRFTLYWYASVDNRYLPLIRALSSQSP